MTFLNWAAFADGSSFYIPKNWLKFSRLNLLAIYYIDYVCLINMNKDRLEQVMICK